MNDILNNIESLKKINHEQSGDILIIKSEADFDTVRLELEKNDIGYVGYENRFVGQYMIKILID